jgi:hypothetical protein
MSASQIVAGIALIVGLAVGCQIIAAQLAPCDQARPQRRGMRAGSYPEVLGMLSRVSASAIAFAPLPARYAAKMRRITSVPMPGRAGVWERRALGQPSSQAG